MKKKVMFACILCVPLFFTLGCAEIIGATIGSTRVPDSRFVGTWTYEEKHDDEDTVYHFYKFDDDSNKGSYGSYVIEKVLKPRPPYMGGDYYAYERQYGSTYDFQWKKEGNSYYKVFGGSFNLQYIDSSQIKIDDRIYEK